MNVVVFEELLEFACREFCSAIGEELSRLSSNEDALQAGNVRIARLISVRKSPNITSGMINGQVNEPFWRTVVRKTSDGFKG